MTRWIRRHRVRRSKTRRACRADDGARRPEAPARALASRERAAGGDMKASSSIRGVVFFPRNVVAPPLAIVVMALLACSGSPPAAAQMSPEDYQHRLAIQRQEPAPPLTSGPGVTAQDV